MATINIDALEELAWTNRMVQCTSLAAQSKCVAPKNVKLPRWVIYLNEQTGEHHLVLRPSKLALNKRYYKGFVMSKDGTVLHHLGKPITKRIQGQIKSFITKQIKMKGYCALSDLPMLDSEVLANG